MRIYREPDLQDDHPFWVLALVFVGIVAFVLFVGTLWAVPAVPA